MHTGYIPDCDPNRNNDQYSDRHNDQHADPDQYTYADGNGHTAAYESIPVAANNDHDPHTPIRLGNIQERVPRL
jgi:hypothetical protein